MGQSGWALSPEAGGRLDVCAFQVTMVSSRLERWVEVQADMGKRRQESCVWNDCFNA